MRRAIKEDATFLQNVGAFWPLILALVATVAFGLYSWSLAGEVTKQDGIVAPRYYHFLQGRPNELGDTLAGFVGSLTLIWIVASVIQQSMELRAQRQEFSEMVRAQDAQVDALNAQARIFEDEKRRRDEDVSRQYIDRLIKSLVSTFRNSDHLSIDWRPIRVISGSEEEFLDYWRFVSGSKLSSNVEDAFLLYSRQALVSASSLTEMTQDSRVKFTDLQMGSNLSYVMFKEELSRVVFLSEEAMSARASASSIEQELLAHLRIEDLLSSAKIVLQIAEDRFE